MLDKARLKKMQRTLFDLGNGKTTAIVATALQVAQAKREDVQIVCHSHAYATQLCDMGYALAKELGIKIAERLSGSLKLEGVFPPFVYFTSYSNEKESILTFRDHYLPYACICSSSVDLDSLYYSGKVGRFD